MEWTATAGSLAGVGVGIGVRYFWGAGAVVYAFVFGGLREGYGRGVMGCNVMRVLGAVYRIV